MNAPVETLLSRLKPHRTGRDRWRAACPVCGGDNQSTLSVGIGDGGNVLLHCFKSGCGADQIVTALDLELVDLFPERPAMPGDGQGPLKRRRMLDAKQALDLLSSETTLVWIAACNLAHGFALTQDDLARLSKAADRIGELAREVAS